MLKNIYLLAFFGLAFGRNLNVSLDDNPALTCYTQPCVDVEGVGKIMGTEKVPIHFKTNIFEGLKKYIYMRYTFFVKPQHS